MENQQQNINSPRCPLENMGYLDSKFETDTRAPEHKLHFPGEIRKRLQHVFIASKFEFMPGDFIDVNHIAFLEHEGKDSDPENTTLYSFHSLIKKPEKGSISQVFEPYIKGGSKLRFLIRVFKQIYTVDVLRKIKAKPKDRFLFYAQYDYYGYEYQLREQKKPEDEIKQLLDDQKTKTHFHCVPGNCTYMCTCDDHEMIKYHCSLCNEVMNDKDSCACGFRNGHGYCVDCGNRFSVMLCGCTPCIYRCVCEN